MLQIKEQLHSHCREFVTLRYNRIEKRLTAIKESLTTETKSSAGDKHETGRAMLQLEREKTGVQLAEILKLKEVVDKTILNEKITAAHLGSLVITSNGNYFLCISAGSCRILEKEYMTIACNTPIGQLLLGQTTGAILTFRNITIEILEIL